MELNLLEQCLTPWAVVINQVVAHPCRDIYAAGIPTEPTPWLIYLGILVKWDLNYLQYLVIAEVFAPSVEALLLNRAYKVNFGRAVLAALIANLISWSVGVFIA
jgi:hypothetical protein